MNERRVAPGVSMLAGMVLGAAGWSLGEVPWLCGVAALTLLVAEALIG